jgi:hypothetical protein
LAAEAAATPRPGVNVPWIRTGSLPSGYPAATENKLSSLLETHALTEKMAFAELEGFVTPIASDLSPVSRPSRAVSPKRHQLVDPHGRTPVWTNDKRDRSPEIPRGWIVVGRACGAVLRFDDIPSKPVINGFGGRRTASRQFAAHCDRRSGESGISDEIASGFSV